MNLNDAIALLNLPDGVIQLAIGLTVIWAITIVIIGFVIALVTAILSL